MKKLIEKLKHPTEKTKHRLQGVAIGSLLGAILTLTCVGVVGCSLSQGETQQPQTHKLNKEPHRKEALSNGSVSFYVINPLNNTNPSTSSTTNDTLVLGAGNVVSAGASIGTLEPSQLASFTWVTMQTFANDNGYLGIGTKYAPISRYSGIAKVTVNLSFVNWDTTYISPYWKRKVSNSQTSYYRQSISVNNSYFPSNEELENYCLDLTGLTPSNNSMPYPTTASEDFTDLFVPMSDVFIGYEMPSDSSEETSSDVSSNDTEINTLDQSLGFTFGDQNPFSAWSVNPLSGDPATNYDGGAPWLLYTGKPSGSGATTETTALATDYAVGSFYVAGNPTQTFDTIRVVTLNLSTDSAFVLNGSSDAVQVTADQFARGAFMVAGVYYRDSVAGTQINVYTFGLTAAKLNGQDINALTSGSWLNVGYRSIVWIGEGDLTINDYSAPASWWLENNALSSASAVSTMILGNSSTGVFGLLASAFSCWGSIFGLALVPGLTIGTLLFVPLVVLVIFSIIKLLQK